MCSLTSWVFFWWLFLTSTKTDLSGKSPISRWYSHLPQWSIDLISISKTSLWVKKQPKAAKLSEQLWSQIPILKDFDSLFFAITIKGTRASRIPEKSRRRSVPKCTFLRVQAVWYHSGDRAPYRHPNSKREASTKHPFWGCFRCSCNFWRAPLKDSPKKNKWVEKSQDFNLCHYSTRDSVMATFVLQPGKKKPGNFKCRLYYKCTSLVTKWGKKAWNFKSRLCHNWFSFAV